jgi:hypothetical protein
MFPVRGPEHQRERRWFSSSSTRCRISPPSATRTTEKRQLAQIGHLVVESRLVAPGHPDHLRRQIEPARCQAPLRQERVETVVPAADVPDSDADVGAQHQLAEEAERRPFLRHAVEGAGVRHP